MLLDSHAAVAVANSNQPMQQPHPSPSELSAYSLGQLAPEAARQVEDHLEDCGPCGETLLGLASDDTFVGMLRGAIRSGENSQQAISSSAVLAEDESIPELLQEHQRYEVTGLIGAGGMGNVYRAQHRLMERTVALKVINQAFVQKPDAVERFQREVKAAAKLAHPNIVAAFDAEQIGNRHFLVMEFVDGTNLADLIKQRGPLTTKQACDYIRQAAMGLQHAHEQGMVHRDIKPHNLMLKEARHDQQASVETENVVKILDFGLASLTATAEIEMQSEDNTGLTLSGSVMGTPDFISPEQAQDASSVDIRSDIYSLGATMYFLLVGKPPFPSGSVVEKIVQHKTKNPPSVRLSRQDVPAVVAQVISKMLSKDPLDRYQTPAEVAAALAPFSQRKAKHNVPFPFVLGTSASRLVALVLAVALLLLSPIAYFTWFDHGSQDQAAKVTTSEGVSLKNESLLVAAAPQTQQRKTKDQPSALPEPKPTDPLIPVAAPKQLVYFSTNLKDLEFSEATPGDLASSKLSEETLKQLDERFWNDLWVWHYIAIEGEGEAYLTPPALSGTKPTIRLALAVPAAKDVQGFLVLPSASGDEMQKLPFTISQSRWSDDAKNDFLILKRQHYRFLANQRLPGASWFRSQADHANTLLGNAQREPVEPPQSNSSIDPTFQIISGGKAISENLQLGQVLSRANGGERNIPIDSIRGVTINEFDFHELNRDINPNLDPLAKLIPADQHALFFESFGGLLNTIDHIKTDGISLLRLAQNDRGFTDVLERYQTQLGLPLNDLARLLGTKIVKSLVLTGGDPYLDTGTDIALVFQPVNEAALKQLFHAQIALAAGSLSGATSAKGTYQDVVFSSWENPNREISSYFASVDGQVVVTNSFVQLKRIIDTSEGRIAAMTATAEYRFFRHRYSLQDEKIGDDSGLLVVTDLAIRRWSGPRWRIGASRRLYARAAMSMLRAQQIQQQQIDGDQGAVQPLQQWESICGKLEFAQENLRSQTYGTLEFLTPISELDVTSVTKAEHDSYENWRTRYERSWRRSFDPLAISFRAQPDSWTADLTIMPLVANTNYRLVMSLIQNAQLNPVAADPHPEGVMQLSISIDKKSPLVQMVAASLGPQLPAPLKSDPLAWFGSTVSLYADDDPFWYREQPEDFNLFDMADGAPIALCFEVKNGLSLVPFLLGLRSYIESVVPGITSWEQHKLGDHAYTKVTLDDRARDTQRAFYYVVTGNHLVFSPSETLIHRSIQRWQETPNNEGDSSSQEEFDPQRWLGKNIAMQLDGRFLKALEAITYSNNEDRARHDSWCALPILNEWNRIYPNTAPIAVHQRIYKRNLTTESEEEFHWNPQLHSMESSIFGAPGTAIGESYAIPIPLRGVRSAAFGITFENQGLRARMSIDRSDPE